MTKKPLVVAVILCLLAVAPTFAEDWAVWRGPNRDGISKERVSVDWPATGPARLWSASLGQSYSAVAVRGGSVYTMGATAADETVFCFDAASGAVRWKHTYPHAKRVSEADPVPIASTATPVLDGDRVYTISREGLALCLDAKTGKPVWKKDLVKETGAKLPYFGFAGSPLVENDRVIYNVGAGGAAVNKLTGALLWKSGVAEAGYTTPVPYVRDGKRFVALFNGEGVYGASVETGTVAWRHNWKTEYGVNATDPIIRGDNVFITAYGKARMLKISGDKAEIVYETKDMVNGTVAPVLIGDFMYGNDNGRLRCVSWKTGKATWDERGLGSGSLIAAGGDLIVLTEQGELQVVTAAPEKFTQRAKVKVIEGKCWTQPILANGRLYCRNNDGDLVCLQVKTGK